MDPMVYKKDTSRLFQFFLGSVGATTGVCLTGFNTTPQFADAECVIDDQRESGRDYYADLCFHVYAKDAEGQWLEMADGGVVNWTQRLLNNAKERCVISGIGSERVCTRFSRHQGLTPQL